MFRKATILAKAPRCESRNSARCLAALCTLTLLANDAHGDAQTKKPQPAPTEAASLSLTVTLHSVSNDQGRLLLGLYRTAADFPKHGKAIRSIAVKARAGEIKAQFTNLTPGQYAIAVLHDENNNGDMDFNLLGMPTEGYGFSRDAAVVLGPPDYDDARFSLTHKASKLRIKVRYFL